MLKPIQIIVIVAIAIPTVLCIKKLLTEIFVLKESKLKIVDTALSILIGVLSIIFVLTESHIWSFFFLACVLINYTLSIFAAKTKKNTPINKNEDL